MTMQIFSGRSSRRRVNYSNDLERIATLRRRTWTPEEAERLAKRMTELLKTPQGQMELRPIQAIMLFELCEIGGVFGPQRCGAGKTLPSLLAPTVIQRVKKKGFRPLLLVPASLLEKTERDRRLLSEHWQIAPFLKIWSYEWLGRVQAGADPQTGRKGALEEYDADLFGMDECHRAKNRRGAAVARRIDRWKTPRPEVQCYALSGTITKRSIRDYAHILRWCMPPADTPVPLHFQELDDWADALDEKKDQSEEGNIDPGELKLLCNEEEQCVWDGGDRRRAARVAFRRRLVETPGVVATAETPIDASLSIRPVTTPLQSCVDEAFRTLRKFWETPDGWPITDGLTMARHARELALGFYYKWDPRPPRTWLEPRRIWAKFVREVLAHSRRFDSELQVRQWAATLHECPELTNWLAVRDTFEPNTIPVWIDDSSLQFAAKWAKSHRGIIWVAHSCVGERLEKDFGIAYYGRKGRNAEGRFIDDHPPSKSLAASISSNKEGRNLQAWAENLLLSMPSNGLAIEQLLSRTHRDGQEEDEVTVDVLVTCMEHLEAFSQAWRDADYIQTTTGSPQKMMLAGIDSAFSRPWGYGPRWSK